MKRLRYSIPPSVFALALTCLTACSSDQKPDPDSAANGQNENDDDDDGGGGGTTQGNGGTPGAQNSGGGTNVIEEGPGWVGSERDRARIFFSGHSLLRRPIQEDVLAIAQSLSKDMNYNMQDIGGSTIKQRTLGGDPSSFAGYSDGNNRDGSGLNIISELRDPKTLGEGEGERYDTLVLAPQFEILPQISRDNALHLLRHYHDRVVESSPTARTFFYQSWYRHVTDSGEVRVKAWIDYEKKSIQTVECGAAKVNLTLGADDRPVVALPAGLALAALFEDALAGRVRGLGGTEAEVIGQIFSDTVHPTRLTSYFIGLVVYASIFGSEPTGTSAAPSEVSAETATDLAAIAWREVSTYYATGGGSKEPTMEECQTAMADVCEAFWTDLKGKPPGAHGADCARDYSGTGERNGFVWPDPHWVTYPTP